MTGVRGLYGGKPKAVYGGCTGKKKTHWMSVLNMLETSVVKKFFQMLGSKIAPGTLLDPNPNICSYQID